MMRGAATYYALFLLWIGSPAIAQESNEDWLCTTASSVRRGNIILACGVATARTEDEARHLALISAKKEFLEICETIPGCPERKADPNPLRTTCKKADVNSTAYTCYRGIEYTITDEKQDRAVFTKGQIEIIREQKRSLESQLELLSELEKEKRELEELEEKLRTGAYANEAASNKRSKSFLSSLFIDWFDESPHRSRLLLHLGLGMSYPGPFNTKLNFDFPLTFRLLLTERVHLHAGVQFSVGMKESVDEIGFSSTTYPTYVSYNAGLPIFFRDWWYIMPEISTLAHSNSPVHFGGAIGFQTWNRDSTIPSYVHLGFRQHGRQARGQIYLNWVYSLYL